MVDYINFKGEGFNAAERYRGQGWGLLQVLHEMKAATADEAPEQFRTAAEKVLRRRVENAPAEKQWINGWVNRVRAY